MKQISNGQIPSVLGYLILGLYTFILYASGFLESWGHNAVLIAIFGAWLIGLIYELAKEWKVTYRSGKELTFDFSQDSLSFLSVFFGTLITFWISVYMGFGAVVTSSLVGILAAVLLKPYAAAIFCGSFVGMASPQCFCYQDIVIAGAISGLIFVFGKHVFNGFGGKLGTTAFAGCVFTSLILGSPLVSADVVGWDIGWLLVVYCVAGALITFMLSTRFELGPVMASGIVGFVAGVFLPVIHGVASGGLFAIGVFAASFAGMSGADRFKESYWMAPVGVLCALIIMYTMPYMGGAGGKLGATAFGAVIGIRGLRDLGARASLLLKMKKVSSPLYVSTQGNK
jgi:hypothetical protein